MSPPIVVDTNVVVAGLLTAGADSTVARVLDGMFTAAFPLAVSEALLDEYRAILRRPSLRKARGLTLNDLDIIVVELAQHGIVLAPVPTPPAPEVGDQHLWELLAAREELVLVTGDRRLQRDRVAGFVWAWGHQGAGPQAR